ncbi:MAG: hypothetical protein J0653_05255, partial [Deltaproteobacteria bacterium]|nr:hypothetical protein [Deltaproteobacteria bacterium]
IAPIDHQSHLLIDLEVLLYRNEEVREAKYGKHPYVGVVAPILIREVRMCLKSFKNLSRGPKSRQSFD